jgi:hypothetical protein
MRCLAFNYSNLSSYVANDEGDQYFVTENDPQLHGAYSSWSTNEDRVDHAESRDEEDPYVRDDEYAEKATIVTASTAPTTMTELESSGNYDYDSVKDDGCYDHKKDNENDQYKIKQSMSDIYIDHSSSECGAIEISPSTENLKFHTDPYTPSQKKTYRSVKNMSRPAKSTLSYASQAGTKISSGVMKINIDSASNVSPFSQMVIENMYSNDQDGSKQRPSKPKTKPNIIRKSTKVKKKQPDRSMNKPPPSQTKGSDICNTGEDHSLKLAKVIERLSRPTKSRFRSSNSSIGSLSSEDNTKNQYEPYRKWSFDNEEFTQMVERVSRPTKARISYTSEVAKGADRGENSKTTKRSSSKPTQDHKVKLAALVARLSRPKKKSSYVAPLKADPSEFQPFRTQENRQNKMIKSKDKKSETSLKPSSIPIKNKIKRKPNSPKSETEETGPSNETNNPHSSLRKLLASSEGDKDHQSYFIYDRYYGRLVAPPTPKMCDSFETQFERYRKSQLEAIRRSEKKSNVHLRLYQVSKNYQMEGKKRREEIEEKRRLNSEILKTKEKISAERACRLYYIGMESIKLRKQRILDASMMDDISQ